MSSLFKLFKIVLRKWYAFPTGVETAVQGPSVKVKIYELAQFPIIIHKIIFWLQWEEKMVCEVCQIIILFITGRLKLEC